MGHANAADKPNIVVIWGDDIGESNISAYSFGLMGYKTPNIDRIAKEGMMFTDYYADQSCTAGRASFITGQSTVRTGLSKVGMPGAKQGMQAEMRERAAAGGLGYGHVKAELHAKLLDYFGPMRAARAEYEAKPERVEEILRDGAARARALAAPVIEGCREAAGLGRPH